MYNWRFRESALAFITVCLPESLMHSPALMSGCQGFSQHNVEDSGIHQILTDSVCGFFTSSHTEWLSWTQSGRGDREECGVPCFASPVP